MARASRSERAARKALKRISAVERDPDGAAAALMRTANALPNSHANEARLLRDAAAAVVSHLAFLRRDIGKAVLTGSWWSRSCPLAAAQGPLSGQQTRVAQGLAPIQSR